MIKPTDKLSEFPDQFNQLENDVKRLSQNTGSIAWAAWLTAGGTIALAAVEIIKIFLGK